VLNDPRDKQSLVSRSISYLVSDEISIGNCDDARSANSSRAGENDVKERKQSHEESDPEQGSLHSIDSLFRQVEQLLNDKDEAVPTLNHAKEPALLVEAIVKAKKEKSEIERYPVRFDTFAP